MNPVLRYVAAIPAALFILSGLGWAFNPTSAAGGLGMSLAEGVGRSSQIGDMGAFFLGSGLMIVVGLVRNKRIWFQAPALLMCLAIFYRTLATLLHDAPFAASFVAIELISAGLLFIAARASDN